MIILREMTTKICRIYTYVKILSFGLSAQISITLSYLVTTKDIILTVKQMYREKMISAGMQITLSTLIFLH